MLADSDLAAVASLMGDPRRASILLALLGGEALPAHELARRAGASSSLASAHLAKLLDGGLLTAERRGRERYYGLAGPEIAHALEGLLAIAPARAATSLHDSRRGRAIRRARSCYDHLAGELGVGLTEALQRQRAIVSRDGGYHLTPSGELQLSELGVDVTAARQRRRSFTGQCVDWTERRPHLAGALGAAIADQLLAQRWVTRLPHTRALLVSSEGAGQLRARFALELGTPRS